MESIEYVFGPPYTPTAKPFVERVIGTTNRDYLDKSLSRTKAELKQKLVEFKYYCNHNCVHSGIDGDKPTSRHERAHFACASSSG